MRRLLVVLAMMFWCAPALADCEVAIILWCERHAVDPARNCLDLTRQACPRADRQACIQGTMSACMRGAIVNGVAIHSNDCGGAAIAYCTQASFDTSRAILVEAAYCVRRTSLWSGEACLGEAIRRNPPQW